MVNKNLIVKEWWLSHKDEDSYSKLFVMVKNDWLIITPVKNCSKAFFPAGDAQGANNHG